MARYLDGVDDWIGGSLAAPSTGWTMSAWCRAETGSVYPCPLVVASTTNTSHRYRFGLITQNDTVPYTRGWYLLGGQGSGDDLAFNAVNAGNTGTWYHGSVTLHVDGGTGYRYATVWQGGVKGTATRFFTLPSSLNIVRIGCEYFSGANQFPSGWTSSPAYGVDVAEIGLWNTVLEDEEHLALADGVPPAQIRPENLLLYTPLYGRSSPEPDLFGGCKLLTVTGAASAKHPPVRRRRRSHGVAKAAGPPAQVLALEPIPLELATVPATTYAQTLTLQPVTVEIEPTTLATSRTLELEPVDLALELPPVAASNGRTLSLEAVPLELELPAVTRQATARTLTLEPVMVDVGLEPLRTRRQLHPEPLAIELTAEAFTRLQGRTLALEPLAIELATLDVALLRAIGGPFCVGAAAVHVPAGAQAEAAEIFVPGQTYAQLTCQ